MTRDTYNLAGARAVVSSLGFTLGNKNSAGEYRLCLKDGTEAQASYSAHLDDLVGNARHEAARATSVTPTELRAALGGACGLLEELIAARGTPEHDKALCEVVAGFRRLTQRPIV